MILDEYESPPNPLKAFDAFPKVHKSYVHSRSSRGGVVSVFLLFGVVILFWTETIRWWKGTEVMEVSMEAGIGHGMQFNVDITVAMSCDGILVLKCYKKSMLTSAIDLDVNVLDATGDRILAGDQLVKEAVVPIFCLAFVLI